MIENVTEVIRTYLEEEDYKILEVEDNGNIRIRYQMSEVCIVPNKNTPNFVSIIVPGFDTMDEEDPVSSIFRCMRLISTQMVVKAYPVNKDTIILSYEFFFNNEEDLCFQIATGLDCLMDFASKYRRTKREDEEEAQREKVEEGKSSDDDWEEIGGNDDDWDGDDDDDDK